jgi:hypothetical protein
MLSTTGALLLFSTYIAKEELRDDAKDRLTEIRVAENAYEMRERFDELANISFAIRDDTNRDPAFGRPFSTPPSKITAGQLRERITPELRELGS